MLWSQKSTKKRETIPTVHYRWHKDSWGNTTVTSSTYELSQKTSKWHRNTQSCTTFLNNSAIGSRGEIRGAFEPSAALSRTMGAQRCIWELQACLFILSLSGTKMNFALVVSQDIRTQVCEERYGVPKILSRRPTKDPSEVALKREEMPASPRPAASYLCSDLWGSLVKQVQPIQSTFSGSQRPSDACRAASSWKNKQHAAVLENSTVWHSWSKRHVRGIRDMTALLHAHNILITDLF